MNLHILPKQVFHYQRFRRIVIFLLTVAIFLAVIVVPMEKGRPGASINSIFDGMWWATTTITTVGYGDKVPVTVPGRVIGMLLQVVGGLLFGSVVGTFTVYLNRARDEYYWQRLFERIDRQSSDIEELRKQINYMVADHEDKSTDSKLKSDNSKPKSEPEAKHKV